jgi:small subunit ribosomal protein S3Ae
MAPKRKGRIKKKKKIWLNILAPQIFDNKKVGETLAEEAEKVVGRVVEVYLFNLTLNPKHQEAKLILKIDEVRGEDALTKIVGYELINTYVKRLVKKRTDRVDTSEIFITKDKEVLRIKPLVITASNTTYSVRKALRFKMLEFLKEKVANSTYEGLLKELISGKLEKDLFGYLKPVMPIKYAKIRKIELIEGVEKERILRMYEKLYNE